MAVVVGVEGWDEGSRDGGGGEGMRGAGMKTRDEVMKGTEDEWKVWGRLDEGKGKGKGIV